MIRIISHFLFACFEIFTVDVLFSAVSKKKLERKFYIPVMSVAIILNALSSYFLTGTGATILVMSSVIALAVGLSYKVKPFLAIIGSVVYTITAGASEMLVVLLTGFFLGEETLSFMENDYIFAGMGFICKFIAFVITYFISRKIGKIDLGVSKGLSSLLFIQPVATVFVTLIIYKCTYEVRSIPTFLYATVAVLMIASNLVTLFFIYRQKDYVESKAKLEFANEQIKNQLAHYEELYNYQNQIRTFRHDIKNKLLSVSGLIADNQIDAAINAIKGEADFLDEANNSIINSGNPAVDAVLQSKLSLAEAKGITLKLSLKITQSIAVDMLELGVLIGNALDNALEAVEALDSSCEKTVFVSIITKGGRLIVSVKNPVDTEIDTKQIDSSKADRINHGYGIKSMKTIAEKYNGDVFVFCEENVFTISINIANTFEH